MKAFNHSEFMEVCPESFNWNYLVKNDLYNIAIEIKHAIYSQLRKDNPGEDEITIINTLRHSLTLIAEIAEIADRCYKPLMPELIEKTRIQKIIGFRYTYDENGNKIFRLAKSGEWITDTTFNGIEYADQDFRYVKTFILQPIYDKE